MREDQREVALAEPPDLSADRERVLDILVAVKLREVNSFGDLAAHPLRAGRRGCDQPSLRAGPDREERRLLTRARPRLTLERPGRARRVVLVLDARPPGRRQVMARDLARALRAVGVNDDELLPVDARPDPLVDQP